MRAKTTEKVLDAWRAAERALQRLPPGTADHERLRAAVIELRALYEELTDAQDLEPGALDRVRTHLAAIELGVADVQARA